MLIAALSAAATWPLMHIAWSLKELTNFGPMSLSSLAVDTVVSTAAWSWPRRAFTESSFGRPFCNALSVISALDLSTTILASSATLSLASVHSMFADACACALALHSPEAFTSAWPSHLPLQVPLHWPWHSPPAAAPPPPAFAPPAHEPSHLPLHVPSHFAPTSADALPSHFAAISSVASTFMRQTAGWYS